jgi:hypothetical protein
MNIRNIYYKRVKTFLKYPFNQEVDTDLVHFSTNKKNFDKNVFLKVNPVLTEKERKKSVAECLGISEKHINLVK